MSAPDPSPRPSIAMSQEEHSALAELTGTVRALATGLNDLKGLVGDLAKGFDSRINAISERGRFTRSDVFAFIGAAVGLAGIVAALLSMRIDTALAPLRTQQQVSIVDQSTMTVRQDKAEAAMVAGKEARLEEASERKKAEAVLTERTNELYYARHGHYPSTH